MTTNIINLYLTSQLIHKGLHYGEAIARARSFEQLKRTLS